MTPDYRATWRLVWQERLTFPLLLARIESTAVQFNHDGKLRQVVVEDKGSGTSMASKRCNARLDSLFGPLVKYIQGLAECEYRCEFPVELVAVMDHGP